MEKKVPKKKTKISTFQGSLEGKLLDKLGKEADLFVSEQPVNSTEEILLTDTIIEEAREKCMKTGDGRVGPKINYMLKSRFQILYIRTPEELRVIKFFQNLSKFRGIDLFQWDVDRGLLVSSTKEQVVSEDSEVNDGVAPAILAHIIDHATKHNSMINKKKKPKEVVYLLLDYHMFLGGDPTVDRKLKEFTEIVSAITIVIIAPVLVCPPTLDKTITLIDFPVPSYSEIKSVLDEMSADVVKYCPQAVKEVSENEEELIKAVSGLTIPEAENAFAMSIVSKQSFDIPTILDEKKQMIQKGGILQYYEPRFTFDDVGGLDTLKDWLDLRRLAFKQDATEFGLSMPKGILIFGIPGSGKSLVCEALASAYEMPLLRLDFGAVFSSHVGESEQNIRQVLQVSGSISPCILWIDEVEKGIGGVESSNATDGGVTSRVFGTMLTWMQDKTDPVFVVCTANNVLSLPPEFMRAGRFDEIFFIDLPNDEQREEVIEKLLGRKKRDAYQFDLDLIVSASENYTPVEIEKGINNALFVAYANGKREVVTSDIVNELKKFPPLYNSRHEEIQAMREWSLGKEGKGGRAILANSRHRLNTSSQISSPEPQKDIGRLANLEL